MSDTEAKPTPVDPATSLKRAAPEDVAKSEESVDTKRVKTETEQSLTELETKIIQQMEYYFGDINLPRDKFLIDEMKKDHGWVSMETMLKFNRLNQLCSDPVQICQALRKSGSGLLEIGEANDRLRRCIEMPENTLDFWKTIKQRSVYVKGFPQDASLDDIQQCLRGFGKLDQVMMRRVRTVDRIFKGSVFATYATREQCESLVNAPSVKFKDVELVRLMQEDYIVQKQQKTAQLRKQQKDDKRTRKVAKLVYQKGMVLRVDGVSAEGDSKWQSLKEHWLKYGPAQHVEHDKGTTTAFVRFGGEVEQTAAAAVAKAQEEAGEGKPLLFEEKPLTVAVLDGDEEADFHVKHADQKRMRAEANKKAQRLKQDEYRNNKGRDKKRGRRQGNETNGGAPVASGKKTVFPDSDDEPDTDTPTSKAPKTEDTHTPVETNANATNTEEEPKKTDTVIG